MTTIMQFSGFLFCVILFFMLYSCSAYPKPQEADGPLSRAEESGGLGSALSGFQSGLSSVMNSSNMKESKLVMGGFSFIIVPSPDMSQLGQMGSGQLPQLPSLPGGKK